MSPRHERKRGHPTSKENIRIPVELVEFAGTMGTNFTQGVVRCLDLAKDAHGELGPLYREVEVRAIAEGVTEGVALAKLALAGLAAAKSRTEAAPVFLPDAPHPFEPWTASTGRSMPDCKRCGRVADAHIEAGLQASLNGHAGAKP